MFYKPISVTLAISIFFLSLTHLTQAQSPAWTQLIANGNTPGAPTERFDHTAIYDAANNRMTIFGGTFMNDVWVLSTANGLGGTSAWTQLNPTPDPVYGLPTTRQAPTAVYDPTNNRMTIFGGYDNNEGYLNDVWVLSTANGLGNSAWTQLSPTPDSTYGLPATRENHTAVYDSTNNRMTIFGGYDGNNNLNDVWVLSNANGLGGTPAWIQLSPTGGPPPARLAHTAVYDAVNNQMIIFGGSGNSSVLNDVWVLSHANGLGGTPAWTQLSPIWEPPPARSGHTAVYDPVNNRMTIFGGESNYLNIYNDVWVLSNANGLGGTPAWIQLSPTGTLVYPRLGHSAVYDAVNNRMTIFGGISYSPNVFNDVWVLSNADSIPVSVPKGIWELFDK